jgi:hypothetical protein
MQELTIKLKNMPPNVATMFEAAFKDVPTHLGQQPMDIPTDGLIIDFKDVTDPEMHADVLRATFQFIMAHGWLLFQKQHNEKPGH